jgi:hypothetical protein
VSHAHLIAARFGEAILDEEVFALTISDFVQPHVQTSMAGHGSFASTPTRRTRADGSARDDNGHATAGPPRKVMKSRRLTPTPSLGLIFKAIARRDPAV